MDTLLRAWACRVIHSALCTMLAAAPAAAQQNVPTDWAWRLDSPAPLVTTLDVPERSWLFVRMPPGWHITTGPGALLYPADPPGLAPAFSLEATIFLFPGESREEFGLFIGGHEIESEGPPQFTAFVLRRDGHAAILARTAAGLTPIVNWQAHDAIVAHPGGSEEPVKNVVRIDVGPAAVQLLVNGATVATVPRAGLRTDGRIGFRIGSGLNLHISSLDLTTRLAPAPGAP
jgi:hypothetical protein